MCRVHVSSCVLNDILMLYYLFMRFKVLKDKSDFSKKSNKFENKCKLNSVSKIGYRKLQRNKASTNTFICHQDYMKYNRMFQYDSLGIISGTYNVGKRSGNLVCSAAISVLFRSSSDRVKRLITI